MLTDEIQKKLKNVSLWNQLGEGEAALREGKEILTLRTLGQTQFSLRKERGRRNTYFWARSSIMHWPQN